MKNTLLKNTLLKNTLLKVSLFAGLAIFASQVFASDESDGFYVWADVVDVTPIVSSRYERIPVSSCRMVDERTTRKSHRRNDDDYAYNRRGRSDDSVLPTLFGSVLGGVIGNQFGSGNGKRAMTVIGAITGASIANANRHDNDRYDYRQPRKICDTSYEVQEYEEVAGYDVTYRYLGREFSRVTDERPGKRLKLYVTVDPVNDRNLI